MLEDFSDLPLRRYPMHPYLQRALSLRENLTAYDAFYVALAESLEARLLTDDHTFTGAPGHGAVIEVWPTGA
ncbi:type II toxin-antitoxin system VapC family toxin [Ornithinimicrobium sp. Y1847]|uniref:type II toxin-antitoxin system VapC family toxin n=1 Tax=unclassified Ornithinimicrobium TaxID=2615080 RepID=UPI003B66B8E2